MIKQIFILFLFFCSLESFSQKSVQKIELKEAVVTNTGLLINDDNELQKDSEGLLLEKAFSDTFIFKVSNFFNEDLLKKSLADV